MVEDVAGEWLKDLLGLPASASFGFVTGGQAANTVCLAAARHQVLADAGWDVEQRGLRDAPALRVVANVERHATVDRSLRLLGLGVDALVPVPARDQGEIDVEDLTRVLRGRIEDADHRVPPGGQREQRRIRRPDAERSRSRISMARGCTSTERSGCGRRPTRRPGTWWPASRPRTPGPPMGTSG